MVAELQFSGDRFQRELLCEMIDGGFPVQFSSFGINPTSDGWRLVDERRHEREDGTICELEPDSDLAIFIASIRALPLVLLEDRIPAMFPVVTCGLRQCIIPLQLANVLVILFALLPRWIDAATEGPPRKVARFMRTFMRQNVIPVETSDNGTTELITESDFASFSVQYDAVGAIVETMMQFSTLQAEARPLWTRHFIDTVASHTEELMRTGYSLFYWADETSHDELDIIYRIWRTSSCWGGWLSLHQALDAHSFASPMQLMEDAKLPPPEIRGIVHESPRSLIAPITPGVVFDSPADPFNKNQAIITSLLYNAYAVRANSGGGAFCPAVTEVEEMRGRVISHSLEHYMLTVRFAAAHECMQGVTDCYRMTSRVQTHPRFVNNEWQWSLQGKCDRHHPNVMPVYGRELLSPVCARYLFMKTRANVGRMRETAIAALETAKRDAKTTHLTAKALANSHDPLRENTSNLAIDVAMQEVAIAKKRAATFAVCPTALRMDKRPRVGE